MPYVTKKHFTVDGKRPTTADWNELCKDDNFNSAVSFFEEAQYSKKLAKQYATEEGENISSICAFIDRLGIGTHQEEAKNYSGYSGPIS